MIFLIFYIISLVITYFSLKGQRELNKSENGLAFVLLLLFFMPIVNLVIVVFATDWHKVTNKFFRLK
jgi:hypothetical protein